MGQITHLVDTPDGCGTRMDIPGMGLASPQSGADPMDTHSVGRLGRPLPYPLLRLAGGIPAAPKQQALRNA